MLDALELFQYSYRFRDALFVLVLQPEIPLSNVLTDLKVIQASHISVLLICAANPGLASAVEVLNQRGLRFSFFSLPSKALLSGRKKQELKKVLSRDDIPLVAITHLGAEEDFGFEEKALSIAESLAADKVFFLSKFPGLEVGGTLLSHLSSQELDEVLRRGEQANLSRNWLEFLHTQNEIRGFDIVLLEGLSGNLFQEIFSHEGQGTLLTDDYPNVIRHATASDVLEISRLLRPYIESGLVLPTSEDEVAAGINHYIVHTVNQAIVAVAKLVDHGDGAELAKFCTLPRFQKKGRATDLAKSMIEIARQKGKNFVFALSIEPKMWALFANLGFTEIPRESLPESWKQNYDFSRPSKAWLLSLAEHRLL